MNIYSNGFTASNLFDHQDGLVLAQGWLAVGIAPPKYVDWTLYAVGDTNGTTTAPLSAFLKKMTFFANPVL